MKRIKIFLAVFYVGAATGYAQPVPAPSGYFIKGHTNANIDRIFLIREADNVLLDSSAVKKGDFTFKGAVKTPFTAVFEINIPDKGSYRPRLILDNCPYSADLQFLSDDEFDIQIKGGRLQQEYRLFQDLGLSYYVAAREIDKLLHDTLWQGGDHPAILQRRLDSLSKFLLSEQARVFASHLSEYTDSYLGPFLIKWSYTGKAQAAAMRRSYDQLSDRIKRSIDGQALLKQIEIYEGQVSVGETIQPFKLPDNHDREFEFKKSIGHKLILLDFWASWCGPCLEEIPVLEKIYAAYKDRGFEVIAISLDKDHARWLKAMEKFKYPWTQLIDRTDEAGSLKKRFRIETIPFNILVDENLKVVGEHLRAIELLEKMNTLMH